MTEREAQEVTTGQLSFGRKSIPSYMWFPSVDLPNKRSEDVNLSDSLLWILAVCMFGYWCVQWITHFTAIAYG